MWQAIIAAILEVLMPKKVARETPVTIKPMPPIYLFDTQEHARHSIRVICDEAGLSFSDKNDITACIYQESEFFNILPNGLPVQCRNYRKRADGSFILDEKGNKVLSSTDWGLIQINDTKGWYIGPPPLPFPSVQFLLDNPEKAVRFIIKMQQQGQLNKWVSYSSGAYKRWLPFVASPVPASGHY